MKIRSSLLLVLVASAGAYFGAAPIASPLRTGDALMKKGRRQGGGPKISTRKSVRKTRTARAPKKRDYGYLLRRDCGALVCARCRKGREGIAKRGSELRTRRREAHQLGAVWRKRSWVVSQSRISRISFVRSRAGGK